VATPLLINCNEAASLNLPLQVKIFGFTRFDVSVVDVFREHVAEIALGMRIEHRRVQRFQEFAILAHQAARTRRDIQLVHRGRRIQCAQGVIARQRVALLLLADRDQGFIDILQLLDEALLHVDGKLGAFEVELEFDVHVQRAGGFDADVGNLVRRIVVALDRALRRHGRIAIHVDQGEIGEAVLVLLALDEEKDLLAVFAEQVIVRIDLVVIGRADDDADIAEPQCFRCQSLEHDRPRVVESSEITIISVRQIPSLGVLAQEGRDPFRPGRRIPGVVRIAHDLLDVDSEHAVFQAVAALTEAGERPGQARHQAARRCQLANRVEQGLYQRRLAIAGRGEPAQGVDQLLRQPVLELVE